MCAQKISLPYVNLTLVPSDPTPEVSDKITTFVGQILAAGTAVTDTLYQDIDNGAEDALCGPGSMAANMIKNFRKVDTSSTINLYAVDDNGAASSAAGIINFTGSVATEAGTLDVRIGDYERKYTIAIADTDAATAIGDALVTLITADSDALVTAVNTTGSVAITAKNGGTVGNNIGIMIAGTVAGVSVALTAMTGGATDPDITGLISAITDLKTDIVVPESYVTAFIITELGNRFNYNNNVLDGRLFKTKVQAKAASVTELNLLNSPSLVYIFDKPVSTTTKIGGAIFGMPYNTSSQFAGCRTLRFSPGAVITQIVTTTASLDQFGGPHTASLPYFNTPLSNLPVIPAGEGFTDAEVSDLIDAGGSVVGNNVAANGIITGEILTTYKTNSAGLADITYKYLNYVDTATASREYIFNALKIDYAQQRLTSGTPVPGYSFASVGSVRADFISYLAALQIGPYVLVQAGAMETGETVMDVVRRYLTVAINNSTGTVTITSILPIVTQVRILIVPLNIVFSPQNL